MKPWWKRLANRAVERDAIHLIEKYNLDARAMATRAAHAARRKQQPILARHYTYVALCIAAFEQRLPVNGSQPHAVDAAKSESLGS